MVDNSPAACNAARAAARWRALASRQRLRRSSLSLWTRALANPPRRARFLRKELLSVNVRLLVRVCSLRICGKRETTRSLVSGSSRSANLLPKHCKIGPRLTAPNLLVFPGPSNLATYRSGKPETEANSAEPGETRNACARARKASIKPSYEANSARGREPASACCGSTLTEQIPR